jgi:hypothetical protein
VGSRDLNTTEAAREAWQVITTQQQLDALPVGSVVMALWDTAPLRRQLCLVRGSRRTPDVSQVRYAAL